MTANPGSQRLWTVLGRVSVLILVAGGLVLSGRFSALWSGAGLAFILVGGAAMILMDFSISDIGTGLKWTAGLSVRSEDLPQISYFWEAAGRNFWLLGALGTVINFILALAQVAKGEGGLQVVALGMTSAFRPSLYGLILAVIFAVPALKARSALKEIPESSGSARPEASGPDSG
jgi:flagellar motor component MotA